MMEETSRSNVADKRCHEMVPARVVLAGMSFLASLVQYMLALNFSAAYSAMTPYSNYTGSYSECGGEVKQASLPNASTASPPDHGPRYDWDSDNLIVIKSAYYWGTFITGFPGGLLADFFGGRRVVLCTTLVSGVLTCLLPYLAGQHWGLFAICRFFIGFVAAPCLPSLHSLFSKWAPPSERSKFIWCLFGGEFGIIVMLPLGSVIVKSLGWPALMYITGALAITWCAFWWYLIHDSPDQHPRISPQERDYIVNALSDSARRTKLRFPFFRISFSLSFWMLVVAHMGYMWGLSFFIGMASVFMEFVQGFDNKQSYGIIYLPHVARLLCGLALSCAADSLLSRPQANKWKIRRWFTVSSHFIPAMLLVAMGYTGCSLASSVVLLTLATGAGGAATVTNLANQHDLAPNFAGALFGTMETAGSIGGLLNARIFNATMGSSMSTRWRYVMIVVSVGYFLSGLLFVSFGTADRQSWNDSGPPLFVVPILPPHRERVSQPAANGREDSRPADDSTRL